MTPFDAIPLWAVFSTLGMLVAFWVAWHIWKQGHKLNDICDMLDQIESHWE